LYWLARWSWQTINRVEAYTSDRFLGGFLHLLWADSPMFGAYGYRNAPGLPVGVGLFANCVQPRSSERFQTVERTPFLLASVLDARLSEVVENHGGEIL
jgi:hypothetical protein